MHTRYTNVVCSRNSFKMSHFAIPCRATALMKYHPNNTASQYTTKLNEVIELDGTWEVRLLEATFPSKADNVSRRLTSNIVTTT